MAQKINPISLRLGKTNRSFDSSWFNDSNYVNLLMRDFKIQGYINSILKKIKYCSARYLIQNLPNKVKINVFFCDADKSRRHISKIFYLSHVKKTKKSKKKFFNKAHTGISVKQGKVFQYLIKNFHDNLSTTTVKLQHEMRFYDEFKNLGKHKNNENTLFLLKNYLKLVYSIKKYNQFYIRYFLIKYFSIKFSGENYYKKIVFNESEFKQKLYGVTLLQNFLFFKIYKNKKYLALNHFSKKVVNYKTIASKHTNLLDLALEKTRRSCFATNFKLKTHLDAFSQVNADSNLYTVFFINNVTTTKLKILSCLKKLKLKYKHLFSKTSFNANSLNKENFTSKNRRFLQLNYSEKNFILNFNNFTGFIKLNENYKILQWYNEKNDSIKFSFFESCLNQKYYNASLINNQYFNDTYNNYCKLSESYKYYNTIYSHENLNPEPTFIKNSKKLILISSPYKYHIESIICNHFSCNINCNFFKTTNIFQNALFLIDEVIYYLEKRVAFFKIKNYILKKLTEQKSLYVKGIRVMCSGRIGGKSKKAQRSKVQNFKYGETSLHVFSSKIDFKSKNAFTSFGTLGIKIWICYH